VFSSRKKTPGEKERNVERTRDGAKRKTGACGGVLVGLTIQGEKSRRVGHGRGQIGKSLMKKL